VFFGGVGGFFWVGWFEGVCGVFLWWFFFFFFFFLLFFFVVWGAMLLRMSP